MVYKKIIDFARDYGLTPNSVYKAKQLKKIHLNRSGNIDSDHKINQAYIRNYASNPTGKIQAKEITNAKPRNKKIETDIEDLDLSDIDVDDLLKRIKVGENPTLLDIKTISQIEQIRQRTTAEKLKLEKEQGSVITLETLDKIIMDIRVLVKKQNLSLTQRGIGERINRLVISMKRQRENKRIAEINDFIDNEMFSLQKEIETEINKILKKELV